MPKQTIRVAMIQHAAVKLKSLNTAISSQQDMELMPVDEPIASAWRKIITACPDVTVFYSPAFGQEEEEAVNKLLKSTISRVLLITRERVSIHDDKLEIFGVPAHEISAARSSWSEVIDAIRAGSGGGRSKPSNVSAVSAAPAARESGLSANILNNHIIAIGASTGGTEALAKLFRLLPGMMPGIVVVQHMPPVFTKLYADRLDRELPFKVVEAENHVQIKPGMICIAPGDRHMEIQRVNGSYHTKLGGTEKVGGHCPAVNVLFESVAKVAGKNATGVILTGMGADGAKGLLSMRNAGAYTFGQDEASSVVYGMPKQAYDMGAVSKQATLTDIPRLLVDHLSRRA